MVVFSFSLQEAQYYFEIQITAQTNGGRKIYHIEILNKNTQENYEKYIPTIIFV